MHTNPVPCQAELEATRAQKLAAETELGAQRAAGRQRTQALQSEVARLEGQVGGGGRDEQAGRYRSGFTAADAGAAGSGGQAGGAGGRGRRRKG